MVRKIIPAPAVALFAGLVLGALLTFVLSGGRPVPVALGQTANGPGGMLLGTEKSPDGSALCFVLEAEPPHLLVYRVDNGGQLYLTASRDIHCDLKLIDRHIPMSNGAATSTRPSVRDVGIAVGERPGSKKAEDGKKKGVTPPEEKGEEGGEEGSEK